METWKTIKHYNGRYKISSYGRVSSVAREITRNDKRGYSYTYMREGKFLKTSLASMGYFVVGLCKDGKAKQFFVHRLVAEHFIINSKNKPQVNHLDGNKKNNYVDNLEWVTASENGLHAHRMGLSTSKRVFGKENHRSLKIKQTKNNGEVRVWDSMMSAKRHGYDTGCICRCCKGQSKKHKNSTWEYTEEDITEHTFNNSGDMEETEEESKICPTCKNNFFTKNSKKVFCCRKCRKKEWDKNHNQNKKDL